MLREGRGSEMASAEFGEEVLHLVTFRLGDEEYGVDIRKVREINRMMEITPVPNAPGHVEGVVNLRGKIIAVLNPRVMFGMPGRGTDGRSRIVVVDTAPPAGLLVDAVSEVLRIPSGAVEPPPPMALGGGSGFVTGVGRQNGRLFILLDVDRLIGEFGGSAAEA